LLDQSFLSGLSSLVDALSDPDRYGSAFARQLATGFVPFSGAMRTITQATDPYVRAPKSISEGVQAVIPGQSEKLLPRLTRFGEPVERGAGAFNVFKPSPVIADPLADVLAAADVHLRPAQGPKDVAIVRGLRVPLSREERFTMGQGEGRTIRRVLDAVTQQPGFAEASPEVQRRLLEQAVSASRAAVSAQVRQRVMERLRAGGR
jgi:hypothetical protein